MTIRSVLRGEGHYLPEKILTNTELSKMVDTSDDWILSRTGIQQRHIAAEGEYTSDLAVAAAKHALEDAGVSISQVDQIIVATTTPDMTFPSTASYVQKKLGATGSAFDVQAVCSGFIYGMAVADSMIKNGLSKTTLLIGAETMSRILDWTDRNTCVLFGDGAGAVVLQAETSDNPDGPTVLCNYLRNDGTHTQSLYVTGGPSVNQQAGFIAMNGKEVFRHAVNNISDAILTLLDQTGFPLEAIDWFVPHQANKRIIGSVGQKIGLDENKVIVTVDRHANTSAASVPLAFCQARADGRIKPGDLVMFEAMGAGFSWGGNLIRL